MFPDQLWNYEWELIPALVMSALAPVSFSLTHARTHTAMHTQEQSCVYTVYQTGKERYIIEDLCKTVASTEQISNRCRYQYIFLPFKQRISL